MKKLIQQNLFFFIPCFFFLIAGAIFLWMNEKNHFEISLNRHIGAPMNGFFYYSTTLGNGFLFLVAVLSLILIHFRWAIMMAASGIVCLILSPLLKNCFFNPSHRPIESLKDIYKFRLVEGVEVFHNNSFPSGHTLTAFALFSMLAFVFPNKWSGFFFFILASLAGFSRVYLAQHFFVDIYVGAILGVVVSALVFQVMNEKLSRSSLLDHSLFSSFKKRS